MIADETGPPVPDIWPAETLEALGICGQRFAITFDDGPDQRWTPRTLDALADQAVVATFFLIGRKASRHRQLAAAIAQAGHLVALHTWNHAPLLGVDDHAWRRQVLDCRSLLEDIIQRPVCYMRAPYGEIDEAAARRARDAELKLVGWNVQADDWERRSASDISATVCALLRPGCIILLHDGGMHQGPTAAAVPAILTEAACRGLSSARVDGVIAGPANRPAG